MCTSTFMDFVNFGIGPVPRVGSLWTVRIGRVLQGLAKRDMICTRYGWVPACYVAE